MREWRLEKKNCRNQRVSKRNLRVCTYMQPFSASHSSNAIQYAALHFEFFFFEKGVGDGMEGARHVIKIGTR